MRHGASGRPQCLLCLAARVSPTAPAPRGTELMFVMCLRLVQVDALQGHRVIDVACGSGDAQTLCLTDDDMVWSWGDGDYGKLGRGGSDGCKIPMKVKQFTQRNGLEVSGGPHEFIPLVCFKNRGDNNNKLSFGVVFFPLRSLT